MENENAQDEQISYNSLSSYAKIILVILSAFIIVECVLVGLQYRQTDQRFLPEDGYYIIGVFQIIFVACVGTVIIFGFLVLVFCSKNRGNLYLVYTLYHF